MSKALHAINLLRFAAGAERPIIGPAKVTWEVTYRCNMRCKHCHLWQVKEHSDLTTEEARTFISDVKQAGTLHISFSGGEPFLREDFLELSSYACDLGLATAVNTNGTRLVTPQSARQACDAGLGAVFVSLDGPDADTHNALRGRPNAFDSALRAIDNLLDQRRGRTPLVFINTTVNRGNIEALEETLALAKARRVDGMTMSIIQDVGKYSPEDEANLDATSLDGFSRRLRKLADESGGLIPHSNEYLDHFQTYLERPNELYKYRCAAGYATALVHPNGEVYPCPVPFACMGNLREKRFPDIWFSQEADEIRRRIKANRHPICWFDCIAPLNVLLHNIRRMNLRSVLHRRTLMHALRKVSR
jgi:MoaA/NifB/PqqE/SkfB family radical SAM enzyme